MVKPGIKKLLFERGKEMAKEKRGQLNLLLLQQSYLVRKIQSGQHNKLGKLFAVQKQIQLWYKNDSEKIKLQSRADEISRAESVRIYHRELHRKKDKKNIYP